MQFRHGASARSASSLVHAVPPWGERKTSLEPCAMHNGGGKEFVGKKTSRQKNLRVHKSNIGKVKMPNYWKRVVFFT